MASRVSTAADSGLRGRRLRAAVNDVQPHAPDGLDEPLILQDLRGLAEGVAGDLVLLLHLDGGGDAPTWGNGPVFDFPPEVVGDLPVGRHWPFPVDDHVRTLARHP